MGLVAAAVQVGIATQQLQQRKHRRQRVTAVQRFRKEGGGEVGAQGSPATQPLPGGRGLRRPGGAVRTGWCGPQVGSHH